MIAAWGRSGGDRLAHYRAFLSRPAVLPVAVCGYVSRLTSGMVGLAMLLLVQRGTHSFAQAGLAVAVYGGAVAAASPAAGKLVDRFGAGRPLLICGCAFPMSLGALVLCVDLRLGLAAILAAAALAGVTVPQTATVVRGLWSTRLPEGPLRQAAFALESVVTDVAFIAGPLLVGVVTPLLGAEWAVGTTAVAAAVGAMGVGRVSGGRSEPADAVVRAPFARPLAVPGLRVLLGAGLVGAAIFGVVPVVVAAHARDVHESAAAVGLVLTLWSAGSIAGGVWYGSRTWRMPAHRQFPWALAAVALGLIPVGLAASTVEMALFLVLGGLALAVVENLELRLIASLTPEGAVTEAFGWFNTASYLGFAGGSALAGLLVDQVGVRAAGLTPALLGLTAVAIAIAWRRRLASAL